MIHVSTGSRNCAKKMVTHGSSDVILSCCVTLHLCKAHGQVFVAGGFRPTVQVTY